MSKNRGFSSFFAHLTSNFRDFLHQKTALFPPVILHEFFPSNSAFFRAKKRPKKRSSRPLIRSIMTLKNRPKKRENG
jgi:hypothetical protein